MKHLKLFEQFINEGFNPPKEFNLEWLKDEPELTEILNKECSKLWKKHKLHYKMPKDGKWGASYTFAKGKSSGPQKDTTELQWSRAEGPGHPSTTNTAADDENGGYDHIQRWVKDIIKVLSKKGYETKRLPGGVDRYDHLVIWHKNK